METEIQSDLRRVIGTLSSFIEWKMIEKESKADKSLEIKDGFFFISNEKILLMKRGPYKT